MAETSASSVKTSDAALRAPEAITAMIDLPLDFHEISPGMFVLTCPVARGIFIGCRSLQEGLKALPSVIRDLAQAQREIDAAKRSARSAAEEPCSEGVTSNPSPTLSDTQKGE